MTVKEKAGCFVAMLAILPLSLGYVLTYLMLVHINATETMWLLFWIYAPFSVVVQMLFKLVENAIKE